MVVVLVNVPPLPVSVMPVPVPPLLVEASDVKAALKVVLVAEMAWATVVPTPVALMLLPAAEETVTVPALVAVRPAPFEVVMASEPKVIPLLSVARLTPVPAVEPLLTVVAPKLTSVVEF